MAVSSAQLVVRGRPQLRLPGVLGSAVVACLALVAACSSTDTPGVAAVEDTGGADLVSLDLGVDLGSPDAAGDGLNDTSGDLGSADAPDGKKDSSETALCDAKPFGSYCACNDGTDCTSGYCLLTSQGKKCAENCTDTCPSGFSCEKVGQPGAGADLAFLCVDRGVYLCMPCEKNSDCATLGFEGKDKCVAYGTSGSFCGIACDATHACPTGFDCSPEGQCKATSGQCTCAPLHKDLQAKTGCSTTNAIGTCTGVRQCEAAGLTACSAPDAVAEICDGKDNDCNTVVDDMNAAACDLTNAFGTCKGKLVCQNGKADCQGVPAAFDECDGKDNDCNGTSDDGWPNKDADKLADCVDPDDDDDGIVDTQDNCPLVANGGQDNSDADALGDACDPDDDGDGWPDAQDCAPLFKLIYPTAIEACDGIDNDCDNATDEATCGDGNPCTTDTCDPQAGCKNLPTTGDCTDNNLCTQKDTCTGGQCAGTSANCNDSNPCTDDACDPTIGCTNKSNTAACTDGNNCTDNDQCSGGSCIPGKLGGCNDKNPCTQDSCDSVNGCTNLNTTDACDDLNPCTVSDQCASGSCKGAEKVCDDGNACTKDLCDPAAIGGCVYVAVDGGQCSDGNSCTASDACKGGQCVGTDTGCDCATDLDCAKFEDGDLCNGTLYCDMANGPNKCRVKASTIVTCAVPVGQDAACVSLVCAPATGLCSAKAVNEGEACDDTSACTDSDVCQAGACKGSKRICVDQSVCTADACDPAKGCVFEPIAGVLGCDDGNACTTGDQCSGGFCSGKSAVVCNDNNPCTNNGCNPATGCVYDPNTAPCGDGDACTQNDTCSGGTCQGSAVTCDDGNACDGVETCDKGVGCLSGKPLNCDDGIKCTNDFCSSLSGCKHEPVHALCQDGELCNGSEACDADKGCVGQNLPDMTPCNDQSNCTSDDHCVSGVCVGQGKSCDDGNACTQDQCDVAAGCSYSALTGTPCSDGNECTVGDTCDTGTCKAGVALQCSDNNPCTNDSCDPQKGCKTSDNTALCDDGNACTTGDACSGGGCVGIPLDCSGVGDGNSCTVNDQCVGGVCVGTQMNCTVLDSACTTGVCQAGGCIAQPKAGNCDDGNPCTLSDTCTDGTCGGTAMSCAALDNACTTGTCENGLCIGKPKPCNVTSIRLSFPSAGLFSTGGAFRLRGSAGQATPVGEAKAGNGHRMRFGFHAR